MHQTPGIGHHQQDAIRQTHGFHEVVGDQQNRAATLHELFAEQGIKLQLQADVE
ncbi:hypothetical protein D3C72_2384650 [compost metagenome]